VVQSDLSLRLTIAGVVLSLISVLIALSSSMAACVGLGMILGVLLAPWVRRASVWLGEHLER
jgi:hypothetical protein